MIYIYIPHPLKNKDTLQASSQRPLPISRAVASAGVLLGLPTPWNFITACSGSGRRSLFQMGKDQRNHNV